MNDYSFKALTEKIDRLIAINQQLKLDNKQLKAEESGWLAERQKLIQQNEMARRKIGEMICRLELLEQDNV
jgi:cell division protein ZapB